MLRSGFVLSFFISRTLTSCLHAHNSVVATTVTPSRRLRTAIIELCRRDPTTTCALDTSVQGQHGRMCHSRGECGEECGGDGFFDIYGVREGEGPGGT